MPPAGSAPWGYQPGHFHPARPGQYPGQYPGHLPGQYAGPAAPATPPRRRALMITSIVLGLVLVLCGGGGTTAYFLITHVGNTGKSSPTAAVDGFLTAVLRDHDVEGANRFVCSESRDKAGLTRKIDELQSYEERFESPRYSWATPTVQSRKGGTAILTVPVKITTGDQRVAEERLRFVAVEKSGWWVCDIGPAG